MREPIDASQPLRRSIRITADDLGYSEATSNAIFAALDAGLITHASLMTNMPGFEHACTEIVRRGLREEIGLHLNLSESKPLTRRILRCPRFCGADGNFVGRTERILRFSEEERTSVRDEIHAQFERAVAQGISISHIDSHHHYHTEWAVLPIVMKLAKQARVPHVRLSRNCGPRISPFKRLFKGVINARLRAGELTMCHWFGSIEDVLSLPGGASGGVEVMVHPAWGDRGELVDATDQRILSTERVGAVQRHLGRMAA